MSVQTRQLAGEGRALAGAGRCALATTLGPLAADAEAACLGAAERAQLESWREDSWRTLEARVGQLAPRDPARWYELLAFEEWCVQSGTTSVPPAFLDLFYRVKPLIPRSAQLALRRLLVKLQGGSRFPAWPLEPAGWELIQIAVASTLLDRGVDAVRFPWFWPDGLTAAAALTHDVESADGLARAPIIAGWEEQRGFRSSFNVVADWYPIDAELLRELRQRGHEIGSHGICHDRSLFASRASFERQLPLLHEFAERAGAVGFRSPATHRVVEWLGDLPFSYDCTMPHSDPYEPIPGGTATLWPFFHGEVVELPYTAPQDHTLYNLLGHRDSTLWRVSSSRWSSATASSRRSPIRTRALSAARRSDAPTASCSTRSRSEPTSGSRFRGTSRHGGAAAVTASRHGMTASRAGRARRSHLRRRQASHPRTTRR